MMQYADLGQSGMMVSRIGLGCMSLKPDAPDHARIIDRAIDGGINYMDTADLYDAGLNEEMLGRAIRGRRDKLVLATKVGNRLHADGSGWDWDPSKAYIISSVEKSLKRLGTSYIDLYQLHGGTIDDPIEETIEAFELLKQQGKIRHYGISSIRPNVIREWTQRSHLVSVMMQYSLLDRRPEEECLDLLHKGEIGVVARGAVAQGLLVNKPARAYLGKDGEEVERARLSVHQHAVGRTPAQTAMQFVLHHSAISAVVAGIRTPGQLEEALAVFEVPQLTKDEYEGLRSTTRPERYKEHR
jgi:aryl-alcohol dehydrogenase-like predicted oxidoreductase